MQRKAGIAGCVVLVAAIATTLWLWRGNSDDGSPPSNPQAAAFSNAPARPNPVPSPATTQHLQAARFPAYDPSMRNAVGPKAYSIQRETAWRAPGDARQQVLALKRQSDAGEGLASYEIELIVRDCRNLINGNPEEAWQALQRAGMRPDPNHLSRLEIGLGECAALSQDPTLYDAPWLARAAEQGSVEAQLLYSIDIEAVIGPASTLTGRDDELQAWRETSLRYLHSLADGGNVDALSALASVYDNGFNVARDPVAVHAYRQVLSRLDPRYIDETTLARERRALAPEQQQKAADQADAIYKRCCSL